MAHSPGDKELSYSPLRSSYGRRKQLLKDNDPGLKQFSPKASFKSNGKLKDNQSNSKRRTQTNIDVRGNALSQGEQDGAGHVLNLENSRKDIMNA